MSPQLIGCGPVGCVVGAEALGEAAGCWFKVRFWRDGKLLRATVYSVANGNPKVVELSIDTAPIARALLRMHTAAHALEASRAGLRRKVSGDVVGWSLGSLWKGVKKAAKAIGRNKLIKGVGKVTRAIAKGAKAVIKSKITGAILSAASVFPLTAPFGAAALGAYAAANAAISSVEAGKKMAKTVKGAVTTIKTGVQLAGAVTQQRKTTSAMVHAAGSLMSPAQRWGVARATTAAGQLTLSAQAKARLAGALSKLPPGASRARAAAKVTGKLGQLSMLRSRAELARRLPPAASASVVRATQLQVKAAPVLSAAAKTAQTLRQPAVRQRLVAIQTRDAQAKRALEGIQKRAQSGELDAQKSAAIVNLVARNRTRIQAMAQANAGGLPGLLITSQGRIVRGRFRVQPTAGGQNVLYQGPGQATSRGSFATVSGPLEGGTGNPVLVGTPELIVNGDLPLDGIRLAGRASGSYPIGPYELQTADGDPVEQVQEVGACACEGSA